MIPYFFVIFLSLVSHFVQGLRNSDIWYRMYLCILCVFLCCGYMCGSDWRQYESMYYNIDLGNVFYGYYAEPGFLFYMVLFRLLHVDFWIFAILNKIFQFLIISRVINKYASDFKYIVWMFLLPKSGFYMFIDYPMRNMIAIAIFLYSIKYIIQKKIIRYLLCAILAMTFHTSAIVVIPLYFVLDKNISTRTYIISLLVVFALFTSRGMFNAILVKATDLSPYILKQVEYYVLGDSIDGEGSLLSMGMFLQIFFFACLLKFRNMISSSKYGRIILNGALCYILLYRLGLSISIFSRFQLYLVVLYAIGIVFLIKKVTPASRSIAISILCLLVSVMGYKDLRRDGWKYVPYSNYLPYAITGSCPDYNYRDNYNPRVTPYKDTISD